MDATCDSPTTDERKSILFGFPEVSDLRIDIGNAKFYVHKYILALSSSYFRHLFMEPTSGYIKIDEFDADEVEKVLEFMYTGSVEIPDLHMAVGLLSAAVVYDIPNLKDFCGEYLKNQVNRNNVLAILTLADASGNMDDLKEHAMDYFLKNHTIVDPGLITELMNLRPTLFPAIFAKLAESHFNLRQLNESN